MQIEDILLASFAALLAGFVDSIVGGGGLVQVPALFVLFPQFPVPAVIGTNRFASVMGTATAAVQYARHVSIPWQSAVLAGVGAGIFSFAGAKVSSYLPPTIVKPVILLLMILIAIYTFANKNLGNTDSEKLRGSWRYGIPVIIGCSAGFYNGFVGPGTGSLLVFAFITFVGYSFLRASAVSKVVNVTADVASLAFFIGSGFVVYELAIPMMLCNMAGSFIGSKMAVLRGSGFVRIVFLGVVGLLLLRFGYDVFIRMGG